MSIPEENIKQVMQLLTEWNPLGNKSDSVEQLDNYRTEAIDILFHLNLTESYSNPAPIVQAVLNGAFDLSLSLDECTVVANKISKILKRTENNGTSNSNL
jgi:hypothetical protein